MNDMIRDLIAYIHGINSWHDANIVRTQFKSFIKHLPDQYRGVISYMAYVEIYRDKGVGYAEHTKTFY